MKRIYLLILLSYCSAFLYSQEVKDSLIEQIQLIKAQQGDSIARIYLITKKDSLEQIGERSSYIFLWGLLTSNMWHAKQTEALKQEYKEYLATLIDDKTINNYSPPSSDLLSTLWQFCYDYYNILYSEGDKETTLAILLAIHRWFELYPEERQTPGYAQSLLDLSLVLVRDMHNYKEGEPFSKEYATIARSVYGENSAQYAVALYNIAILPQIQTDETILFLEQAIAIYERAGSPDPSLLQQMKKSLNMQNALTSGYTNTTSIDVTERISIEDCTQLVVAGRGQLALKSLLYYRDSLKNEEYIDTLRYASIESLLVNVYMQIGDYASAQSEIENFDSEIGINRETLPANYVGTFTSYVGQIAYRLKDYPKALKFSQAACKLLEESGNYGIGYSNILSNIAMIYAEAGEYLDSQFYLDSKWYIDEAISSFEERIGPLEEHGNAGITMLSNAAIVYNAIGDNDNAISTLERIVNNFKDNIETHDAWALAANNLATIYAKHERWADAESLLLLSLNSGKADYMYLFSQNLILCRLYLDNKNKTIEALENMNHYAISDIAGVFSHFAGVERDDYWTQISKELICFNNLVAYHTKDNQAVSIAYDNALFCKGLLLNYSTLMDKFFANLTDSQMQSDYNIYKYLKDQIAFKTEDAIKKDSLSREITRYEKRLLEYIGNLGDLLKKESRTWLDVKTSLNDNEIAIEFCYAPKMEHFPDLQPYYGAFIIRKDLDYPILVSLENVDDVEGVFDEIESDPFKINEFYTSSSSVTLYNMLWSKLMPYMDGVKKVYYSPTGYLANINFDVLRDENGLMLNERFAMHRVSSTANILDIKTSDTVSYHSSFLYGNIKYDETEEEMASASTSYQTFAGIVIDDKLALRSESERGKWGPIPYTKTEIDIVDSLLSIQNIEVNVYEGNLANEESFKALSGNSPDILHLATHGFVIDTPLKAEGNKFVASTNIYSQKESYMMWAGLMLAGGNNIWQGKFNLTNVEDGVLTADEISRLDLSNTKLVVLSACETARGKVDPIDGVYGLQRAFKMAGVQTIIMSLWKVGDESTAMLMTRFYTYLTSGIEKHQALWNAMMDVREKYKDPYYWAGFIMLD